MGAVSQGLTPRLGATRNQDRENIFSSRAVSDRFSDLKGSVINTYTCTTLNGLDVL